MRTFKLSAPAIAGIIVISTLIAALFTYGFVGAVTGELTVTETNFKRDYSYLVYLDGSTYYGQSGETGQATYSGTNATLVMQNTMAAMSSGTMYLDEVAWNTSLTITANVMVVEQLNGVQRRFINSADSEGSPYTISTDGTNYHAQDREGSYINSWESTNMTELYESVRDSTSNPLKILFENGTYPLQNIVPQDSLWICGESKGGVIFKNDGSANTIYYNDNVDQLVDFRITNIYFQTSGTGAYNHIYLNNTKQFIFENSQIYDLTNTLSNGGIYLKTSYLASFRNFEVTVNGTGIQTLDSNFNTFKEGIVQSRTKNSILEQSCAFNIWENINDEITPSAAFASIQIEGGMGTQIITPYIDAQNVRSRCIDILAYSGTNSENILIKGGNVNDALYDGIRLDDTDVFVIDEVHFDNNLDDVEILSGAVDGEVTDTNRWSSATISGVIENAGSNNRLPWHTSTRVDTSTANYTFTTGMNMLTKTIIMDASGGVRSVNLEPAAKAGEGMMHTIVKIDASNNVTIVADGVETINGAASFDLTAQYNSVTVVSTGSEWYIIDKQA